MKDFIIYVTQCHKISSCFFRNWLQGWQTFGRWISFHWSYGKNEEGKGNTLHETNSSLLKHCWGPASWCYVCFGWYICFLGQVSESVVVFVSWCFLRGMMGAIFRVCPSFTARNRGLRWGSSRESRWHNSQKVLVRGHDKPMHGSCAYFPGGLGGFKLVVCSSLFGGILMSIFLRWVAQPPISASTSSFVDLVGRFKVVDLPPQMVPTHRNLGENQGEGPNLPAKGHGPKLGGQTNCLQKCWGSWSQRLLDW